MIKSTLSFTAKVFFLALSLFFVSSDLFATTYEVLNINDTGAGSLRQAIIDANANGGADVINFSQGHNGTITLASLITIKDDLTINGNGLITV